VSTAEEAQSVRYWLTDKGWEAVGGRRPRWSCQTCDAHGDDEGGAAKHVRETAHSTVERGMP